MYLPKIGTNYYFDGVSWTVVGTGNETFVHEADNGVFALVNLEDLECVLVIIREKKVKIVVDPTIPSVKANNEELLKVYGDVGTYALLEFDKYNN